MSHHRMNFWIAVLFSAIAVAAVGHEGVQAQGAAPVIWQLMPCIKNAGQAGFTLTVVGELFPQGTQILWNGQARTTSVFSPGVLETSISASDIANPAIIPVTVSVPGGTPSNAINFTVATSNPAPVLTSLVPSHAPLGSLGFTLTVQGQGFTASSVVRWNGSDRPTTLVDSGTLTAEIPATDLTEKGEVQIAVLDSAPGGGVSVAKTFTVSEYTGLMYFPHLVIGGGYRTILTLINNGNEDSVAELKLKTPTGGSWQVQGFRGSADLGVHASFMMTVPKGGTRILTFATADSSQDEKSGWMQVTTTTASVHGVLTFQQLQGTTLVALAGVLPASGMTSASIPVDNNWNLAREVGFAITNPGTQDINIGLIVTDEEGNVAAAVNPPELNPLRPGSQAAKYLWQILPACRDFQGTMTLSVSGAGGEFAAIALTFNQALMAVIPVMPGAVR